MLIVAKKTPTPEECRRWLATPEGLIQAATRIDGKRTRLTAYQKHHLRNGARFRAWEKGRGVGFSLTCAAEATVRAIVRPSYSAIFVSVNREEADEKIRYANMLHDSMPLSWQKKKVVDNRAALEFEGPGGGRSRLISHPCKDPRGKHNADLYLDEFAHFGPRKQRSIYVASLPVVSRGGRQLTIGSTPLVAGDLFHDIMRQEHKKYSTFSRQSVPWWICPDLCTDVRRAGREAPGMDTVERVERFAREALLDVFRSLDVAAFRQEYELLFPDESENYFPYDLIFSCVRPHAEHVGTRGPRKTIEAPRLSLRQVVRPVALQGPGGVAAEDDEAVQATQAALHRPARNRDEHGREPPLRVRLARRGGRHDRSGEGIAGCGHAHRP